MDIEDFLRLTVARHMILFSWIEYQSIYLVIFFLHLIFFSNDDRLLTFNRFLRLQLCIDLHCYCAEWQSIHIQNTQFNWTNWSIILNVIRSVWYNERVICSRCATQVNKNSQIKIDPHRVSFIRRGILDYFSYLFRWISNHLPKYGANCQFNGNSSNALQENWLLEIFHYSRTKQPIENLWTENVDCAPAKLRLFCDSAKQRIFELLVYSIDIQTKRKTIQHTGTDREF